MPSITLDFTVAKGLRFFEAVEGLGIVPIEDGEGVYYEQLDVLKSALIKLAARTTHGFETQVAREAVNVVEDLDIAT